MDGNAESVRVIIKNILRTLMEKTSHPYILIGGSSLLLHGSRRITNDIDLLVPPGTSDDFSAFLKVILEENKQKWIKTADMLVVMVERLDFETTKPFTLEIDCIKVPDLDVLLGSKVLSHYLRPDGLRGDAKRISDLEDINWISHTLKDRGQKVRKEVVDLLPCGPYNMVLVVGSLYGTFGKESVEVFELVGGREFECEWNRKEFVGQIELYELEVEEYSGEGLELVQSRRRIRVKCIT